MTDTYQAVYDAVRSKMSNGDIGSAIEQAVRNVNMGHYVELAGIAAQEAAYEYIRPCVLYKPKVYLDGDVWCALYGENIQEGVVGFGESPSKAMYNFDENWCKEIPKQEGESK